MSPEWITVRLIPVGLQPETPLPVSRRLISAGLSCNIYSCSGCGEYIVRGVFSPPCYVQFTIQVTPASFVSLIFHDLQDLISAAGAPRIVFIYFFRMISSHTVLGCVD